MAAWKCWSENATCRDKPVLLAAFKDTEIHEASEGKEYRIGRSGGIGDVLERYRRGGGRDALEALERLGGRECRMGMVEVVGLEIY